MKSQLIRSACTADRIGQAFAAVGHLVVDIYQYKTKRIIYLMNAIYRLIYLPIVT